MALVHTHLQNAMQCIAMVCNLLVNVFALSCLAAWLCKNEQKNTFVTTFAAELLRAGTLFVFLRRIAFVLNKRIQHIRTIRSKGAKKLFIFSLSAAHSAAKQQQKGGWKKNRKRDQNLFWFSGNLLHAMPSRAEPYQDIALSSFRTRWIIRRLLLGQIKRRFVTRQIFSWNQNCNKKVSGKRHSLAHSIAFFSNMRLDFPLHDCYDFKRALPHFGNRIGMNIETKHNSKQENPCHFATISFERISW